ncbi:MAG: hypothetical protein GY788_01790, partial [bacterium]|nr:hypothetical protein [bacterium]
MPHLILRASTRTIALCLAVVAIAGLLPPAAASAADLEQPPKLVGLATQTFDTDAATYETAVGIAPALRQAFWSLSHDWPNAWAPAELDRIEAIGSVTYVEITSYDLDGLVAGAQDNTVAAMVDTIGGWLAAGTNRQIVIAPLPEANLVDFAWGADPVGYKAGYKRIRAAFRDAGLGPDQVRFVFAMHGTSSPGFSMADFYPGDDVVDVIGFSIINRNNPWHDYDSAFQQFIDEIKGTISQSKPILITQTASVVEDQDRASWLRDMFTNLGAESQVIGFIYFNRIKTEGGKYNDYQVIKDDGIDPAFRDGAVDWASPRGVDWLFDGRMDSWVTAREEAFAGVPYFRDIGDSPFEFDILWLASQGITQGCNPPVNDQFCPTGTVTRGQMA